jgi:glycine oxidase
VTADAIWRLTATTETRAALSPGVPVDLPRAPDVLVVGGGMLGLATAAACVRAGLGEVLLLERDELAAGASGGAAALLTPEAHAWTDSSAFVALARRSLAQWRTLDREWDGALGIESLEWLAILPMELPPGTDLGPTATVLDADGARALEPQLGELPGALHLPDQARVDPLRAAIAFAARGGTVATGVEMLGLHVRDGRVTTVDTTAGDVHPGAVVFATGLAPPVPGLAVPQEWVKGHLLATVPAPFRLRTQLATPECLALQLPGGEIVAGGTLDEGDHDPGVRADVVTGIRDELAGLVPATRDLATRTAWCCFRPAAMDREPVIDRVPGLDDAWVTCGHFRTGILMAPGTGDAIARWIATGEQPPEVAAFPATRFEP